MSNNNLLPNKHQQQQTTAQPQMQRGGVDRGNNNNNNNDYRQSNQNFPRDNEQYNNYHSRRNFYNNYNNNNNNNNNRYFPRRRNNNNNHMFFYNNRYNNRQEFNGPPSRSFHQQSRSRSGARSDRSEFNGPSSRFFHHQSRSRSGTRSDQGKHNNGQRRQLTLKDFMPPQLSISSSRLNLPDDFDLISTATPVDALPQRSTTQTIRRTTTSINNDTQPFDIINDNQRPQPLTQATTTLTTKTTTSSFRRRQRRLKRREFAQNQNQDVNHNRYATLDNENLDNDNGNEEISSGIGDDNEDDDDGVNIIINGEQIKNKNGKQKQKQKPRAYLEPVRIMRFMQDHALQAVGGRANQAYILATTPIYDTWVRNNYDLQVWQIYLKFGTENQHWAKDIIKRTKKRDNVINTRYVKKKINQLTTAIAQASASITSFQVELGTYWTQSLIGTSTTTTSSTTTTHRSRDTSATASGSVNRTREGIDRLEKYILSYIQHCTKHVRKLAENKIQLVKLQMEEYKALKDFEQIALPSQMNIHLMLKSKTKMWSTKNKNYQTAIKRIEYDLPPKFILANDLTFKIDESIIDQDECQTMYDEMRQIVRNFRLQAMTLYVRSTKRELEILTNEINNIILGFPEDNEENEDDSDVTSGLVAFKHYHKIREERYTLETLQSLYFLEEQHIEKKPPYNNQEEEDGEEVLAPTLTRSLDEAFSLQM
jgi:hypothetical protein